MRRLVRRFGVVVLALGLLSSAAGAVAPPGGGGRIVFVSNRAPDLDHTRFAAVTPTGSRTLEIGLAPAGAALAPDRRHYAYVDRVGSTTRLVVGSITDDSARTVASLGYGIENPVWSPAGDRIAYTAINPASCGPGDHLCATFELWVVGVNGGDARKLADHAAEPVWSPNGNLLAFAGEYETYAANDGWKGKPYVAYVHSTLVRRIVDVYGVDRVSWSPSSDRVVVSAHRGFAAIAPVAGGTVRKVLAARGGVWSPQGDAIAVLRGRSIALLRLDGKLIRVIRTPNAPQAVTWSPDGARLAYLVSISPGGSPGALYGRRALVTVTARGRDPHTVARFDRFQLARVLGWLREGYVLYATWRDANDFELFTVNGDGTGLGQLTDDDVQQFDPAWSPDGRRIAFAQQNNESIPRTELWSMTTQGAKTRVTAPPPGASDLEPAWSPDGKLIAFSRYVGSGGDPDVFVVRPDGTELVQVTHGGGFAPSWLPDSRRLLVSRTQQFQRFVHVVGADGSGERRLFEGLWGVPSRDGSRVAYVAQRASNAVGLWVANADGSDARLVANDPYGPPSWSPDGTRLVFQRFSPQSKGSVVSVGVADRDEALLAGVGADDHSPDWSRLP